MNGTRAGGETLTIVLPTLRFVLAICGHDLSATEGIYGLWNEQWLDELGVTNERAARESDGRDAGFYISANNTYVQYFAFGVHHVGCTDVTQTEKNVRISGILMDAAYVFFP